VTSSLGQIEEVATEKGDEKRLDVVPLAQRSETI
jgi:hypothetical protein